MKLFIYVRKGSLQRNRWMESERGRQLKMWDIGRANIDCE